MDSQVEYRFNTGILSHTTLFGLDMKYYQISDFQASLFPATDQRPQSGLYAERPVHWRRIATAR
jgi:hypothetical protein